MTKLVKKTKNFTISSNNLIRNSNLSWKARGLFLYLWSLPNNWHFHESEITTHATDGLSSTNSGIQELEKFNYLSIQHKHSKLGKINGTTWKLNDNPHLDNPNVEKPNVDNPHLDNRKLPNTNNTNHLSSPNTKLTNTDNGEAKIRDFIVKGLEELGVNINTFVSQDINEWINHYDPKLIRKAINQVGSTSPSPMWVVKDISTQLSRGCRVHQPKRSYHYGHQTIQGKLPKWARDDYHVKLHPTSKKMQRKIQKQLHDLNNRGKK